MVDQYCEKVNCKYGDASRTVPQLFELDAMRPLAEYIIANGDGGHPAQQLCKWVANALLFKSDESTFGYNYWQVPTEALQNGFGDCEDHALLLSSMLESLGYFATVSMSGIHAYTEVKTEDGVWWILEPSYGTVIYKSRDRDPDDWKYYGILYAIWTRYPGVCYHGYDIKILDIWPEDPKVLAESQLSNPIPMPSSYSPGQTIRITGILRGINDVRLAFRPVKLIEESTLNVISTGVTDSNGEYSLPVVVPYMDTVYRVSFPGDKEIIKTATVTVPTVEEVLALL